jgi:hypothetical protein
MIRTAWKGCLASLFLAATVLTAQSQPKFDGAWQMNIAKSQVNDGRVLAVTIVTVNDGIKISIKTHKSDGTEFVTEFTSQLNGKACEASEQGHTSKLTVWYDGPVLNACKENGPPGDVSALWKFELSPDKQTMTMKINHYDPVSDDETIIFTQK